jgi:hypothetical protein
MFSYCRIFGTPITSGIARGAFAGWVLMATSGAVLAYRPFDGTDAAVAKFGDVEIELAPDDLLREHSQTTIISGFTILNLGIAPNWEAVFSGQAQNPQFVTDTPFSLGNVSAFLKTVVRPGVLQDKSGPSVAIEFGVLLPGFLDEEGYGAHLGGIVSQRWDWGTINWNLQGEYTRDHHADGFASAIIEGPDKWKVRPVSEFFYEEEIGVARTLSALVGAIWQVNDDLAFDLAVRHAIVNDAGTTGWHPVDEIRAGVTFAFPMSMFSPNRRADK